MTENRTACPSCSQSSRPPELVHRDAKAGPEFGSVVYSSTQQVLAFIPPAHGLPAYAAASGHAVGASGMPCLVKGLLKGADPEGVLSVGPSPEEGFLKALQQGRHHRPLSSGPNTGSPKQANNWSSGQGRSGSSAQDQPHTQHPAPLVVGLPSISIGPGALLRGTPSAEAAMPAPPTGKPAGSLPAFGTPGLSSATPMAGVSAPLQAEQQQEPCSVTGCQQVCFWYLHHQTCWQSVTEPGSCCCSAWSLWELVHSQIFWYQYWWPSCG